MLDVNVGLKSGQDTHLLLKRKMLNLVDVGKINGIEDMYPQQVSVFQDSQL